MRSVVQRVSQASVTVEGDVVGQIGPGLMVLLGVAQGDTEAEAAWLADKLTCLRIFDDDQGKMNRSLLDACGQMLVVSQFTLLGDCRKGRRPSFVGAADPTVAESLYEAFVTRVRSTADQEGKLLTVQTGRFRTHMDVSLVNDGPITLIVETPAK